VLLGLRVAPKEETGVSAAEEVYGTQLVQPSQLKLRAGAPPPRTVPPGVEEAPAVQQKEDQLPVAADRPPTYAEVVSAPLLQLQTAEFVYVRSGQTSGPFSPPYSGPYKVINRKDKVLRFKLVLEWKVSQLTGSSLTGKNTWGAVAAWQAAWDRRQWQYAPYGCITGGGPCSVRVLVNLCKLNLCIDTKMREIKFSTVLSIKQSRSVNYFLSCLFRKSGEVIIVTTTYSFRTERFEKIREPVFITAGGKCVKTGPLPSRRLLRQHVEFAKSYE
jgi:hypothetical protein